MTESALLCQIREYLERCRIMYERNNVGIKGYVRFGSKGMPDLMCMLPGGRMLWIETKTEDGRLSKDQQEYICRLRSLGHRVIVARDVRDVEEALEVMV